MQSEIDYSLIWSKFHSKEEGLGKIVDVYREEKGIEFRVMKSHRKILVNDSVVSYK